MNCNTCQIKKEDGTPAGCGNHGYCAAGSCNKLGTYDWLANIPSSEYDDSKYVEVSFNKGSRKEFFKINNGHPVITGDMVAVEAPFGYDIGSISLSGELVKLQMQKKKAKEKDDIKKILRKASERDLDKYESAKKKEYDLMVKSRTIVKKLNLDMKIGEVEYQGDMKKITFYYTADGRIDFRQLIKEFAHEFKTKIEMRQIGSRQEAGKIGGIGSCGRELCCSTWLTDFKSVTTNAARYQNLAINQAKLSGQCGRLKCCLNYELDAYMDALEEFPENADKIIFETGEAYLQKTDIFKSLMIYSQPNKTRFLKLTTGQVKEILTLNADGKTPPLPEEEVETEHTYGKADDMVGHISIETLDKKEKKKKRKRNSRNRNNRKRRNK